MISGPAVRMPGTAWLTSARLMARSSMNRTSAGRSWASSTICATRGPFGDQSMRANTNSAHSPSASSRARASASSFFEQIELTIPRPLRVRTRSATDGSMVTGPSLSVPAQRVSSRSQTTSFTASEQFLGGRIAPGRPLRPPAQGVRPIGK